MTPESRRKIVVTPDEIQIRGPGSVTRPYRFSKVGRLFEWVDQRGRGLQRLFRPIFLSWLVAIPASCCTISMLGMPYEPIS
jgi:hypothetical protein